MAMTPSNGTPAAHNASFSLKPERTTDLLLHGGGAAVRAGWDVQLQLPSILSQRRVKTAWPVILQ